MISKILFGVLVAMCVCSDTFGADTLGYEVSRTYESRCIGGEATECTVFKIRNTSENDVWVYFDADRGQSDLISIRNRFLKIPEGGMMSLFNFMFDETNWGDKVWLGSDFFKVLQPEEIFYVILDTVNQSLIDAFRKVMRIVNLKEAGARYKLLTYINRDTRPAYQLDSVFVNMPSANTNTAISSDSIFNYISHQTVRYQK